MKMKYLILTLSVLMFLAQPAKTIDIDPKIKAKMEVKTATLKGEFIWKAKDSDSQTTCRIIESDVEISEPGTSAIYADDRLLGWETYKPWGVYCEDLIIFLPIGTVEKDTTIEIAQALIRMTSVALNYERHNMAVGKDNYDPFAHKKREKKRKEHLEKK